MASRRWLVWVLSAETIVLVAAACSSFSGNDAINGSDAAPEASGTIDAGSHDAFVPATDASPDAGPLSCTAFDAAASQPPTSLLNQTCGASSGLNLGADPNNCGWCGHACENGCDGAGHCNPALVGQSPDTMTLFAVDEANAYGTRFSHGIVERFALDAGPDAAAVTLATVTASDPTGYVYSAVLDDRIYARLYTTIEVAPPGGGTFTVLANVPQPNSYTAIVVQGAHLFETSADTFTDYLKDGSVRTALPNVSGAGEITVTPNGKYAFFAARSGADGGFDASADAAVIRTALYRYEVASRQLQELLDYDSIDGLIPPGGGTYLAADDDYVFIAEGRNGDILRVPTEAMPPAVPTVLAAGKGRVVNTIAIDRDRVYWFQGTPSPVYMDLHSISKCGGGEFEYMSVSQHFYRPYSLIPTASHLYFAQDSQIYRVTK